MDRLLDQKTFTTSRNFPYRYYLSPAPSSPPPSTSPILLLLHGWPDGAGLWQFIVPLLQRSAPHLRILAPDLLGYGGSAKPTAPEHFTTDLMARDVLEILAHEGLSRQPLLPIGHDWGAFFAQRLYLGHPARCAGLVTLSVAYAAPGAEGFDLDAVNAMSERAFGYPSYAYWELFTAGDGPGLLRERVESLWHVLHGEGEGWTRGMFCVRGAMRGCLEGDRRDVGLKEYARDEGLRRGWVEMMREGGFEAPCCWYRVVKENYQTEVEKTLPREVEKPYLFIGSDGDPVCRSDLVQAPIQEGLLKDVTVKEIVSGHWMPYEKPDEVAGILIDWLKEKKFV